MRELKFRVWDNVDYMSGVFTLNDLQEKKIGFTNEFILMQYTGLKDKNGVEIYEGDVFLNGENKTTIEYMGGSFVAIRLDKSGAILLSFIVSNEKNKVIGNIHENPELLK